MLERLETEFNNEVQQIAKRAEATADYPTIDDVTVERSELMVEVWVALYGSSEEAMMDFFYERIIAAGGAFPVRFTVLNLLFLLATQPDIDKQFDLGITRQWLAERLASAVLLRDVSTIDDPKTIRWEIVNFCAIKDWGTAANLYHRLKYLGSISPEEHLALLGQMYLWSVIGFHLDIKPDSRLVWWAPHLDAEVSTRLAVLLDWAMKPSAKQEYSKAELDRISDATLEWAQAFRSLSAVPIWYRAALGKCYFLSQDFGRAAHEYDVFLDASKTAERNPFRLSAFQRAADSYAESGDTETAIRLLQECTEEFPNTKGLWRKLADLYRLSMPPDLQRAVECLRKEEEVDRSFGEDPIVSFALSFAEVAGTDLGKPLREYADSHPVVSRVLDRVVMQHFPEFKYLDERSRKEWVGAAHMIWSGNELYDENRSRAAGHFSAIAERELLRLFDRFRREKRWIVLNSASAQHKQDDPLLKYLGGGNIELGTMIWEINDCRDSPDPRHPELKCWLTDNASRLINEWDSERGRRLVRLRNPSSHGRDLSESKSGDL
ncbi:MAG: tetratricopeptide repeat protein [Acidobacteriaceae bacterium]|nr:tetratricopeptide repeat protein [Acidobacteriaceae bacterium]